jgi:LmbE family N-acetylglucosaminyl deacetylase
MKEKELKPEGRRALVISAHPDDLDFGCSGTVALWIRQGWEFLYVICTNGDKGTDDVEMDAEKLVEIRKEEQRAAARTVGVREVLFLGVEDGELENTPELRRKLVEAIRRFRPNVVFCQDPANRSFENVYVSHRDHREAAEAAFDALYPAAANPRFFPELLSGGLLPHRVEEVLFFGTQAPNFWVDISSVMEIKLKALFCHRSQLARRGDLEPLLRERFREQGKAKGYAYAEVFRRLILPP